MKLLLTAVVAAASIGSIQGPAKPPVTVFAAASLSEAMEDIRVRYQRESGQLLRLSTAASSTLARQIESGADAGVFISADLEWVDYLERRHLTVPSSRVALAGNRLVLIAPADRATAIEIKPGFRLDAPLGRGRLAIGDPAHVPAGRYAREALTNLGAWAGVEHRIVSTDSVRAALVLVERGEVPLGIVYDTDARLSAKVRVAGVFPSASHRPIVYPMVLIAGHDGPGARAIYQYLSGEAARAVFRSYGFLNP